MLLGGRCWVGPRNGRGGIWVDNGFQDEYIPWIGVEVEVEQIIS